MSYVICRGCTGMNLGGCAGGCRDVCPVDCIQKGVVVIGGGLNAQFFIDPAACIECGRCAAVCAEGVILPEEDLPASRQGAAEAGAEFFPYGLRFANID